MPGENQVEVSVKFETRWTNGFPGRREVEYLNYACVISIPSLTCLELSKFHFVSTSRLKWLSPKAKYVVDP